MSTSSNRVQELVEQNLAANQARRDQEEDRQEGNIDPSQHPESVQSRKEETSSENQSTTEGDDINLYDDLLTDEEADHFGVKREAPDEGIPTSREEPLAPKPAKPEQPEEQPKKAEKPAEETVQVEAPPEEIIEEVQTETKSSEEKPPKEVVEEKRPPEMTQEQYQEARQKAIEDLTKRYALTEEDEDNLLTEPGRVLPQLAARVYLDVFDHVTHMFQNLAPNLVRGVLQADTTEKQNEEAFYSEWDQLRPHSDVVNRVAKAYKESNPGASREQFIREVGATACIALRLPLEGKVETTPKKETRPTPPPPPAGRGSSPPPPRPTKGTPNVFEEIAQEWEEEDAEEGL